MCSNICGSTVDQVRVPQRPVLDGLTLLKSEIKRSGMSVDIFKTKLLVIDRYDWLWYHSYDEH